jgi:hypothetical protein
VRDLLLDEVVLILAGCDVESAARGEPAALERVVVRIGERDELVVLLEVRDGEAAGPAHVLER